MTALLDAPADLTGLTDDQLATLCAGADDTTIAAVIAEGERRDRAARLDAGRRAAGRKYEALRLEWYENCAYSEYMQAQAYCSGGKMLSPLGERNTDEPSTLWTGSEEDAQAWASEELRGWWLDHPRTTFRAWLRQRARGMRAQRDDHDTAIHESGSRRNGAGPATGTTSPHTCHSTRNMPVTQAKHPGIGGTMDTEQAPAPAGYGGRMDAARHSAQAKIDAARARLKAEADTRTQARNEAIDDTVAEIQRPRTEVATREPVPVAQRPPAGLAARTQIDGAKLLDDIRKYWRRYAWFDSESKLTAISLWTLCTHVRDASGAVIFPELAHLGFFSSEPGSGKTRCLQILQMLGAGAPSIPIEPSEATVALMLGKEHRLLLLDEGDVLFGSGNRKSAIRAILNSSYKQGGTWPRVRKGAVDDVPVDGGAVSGAFLDIVEKGTGSTLAALMQRFLKVRMLKPPAGTVIRKPREIVGEFQGQAITGEDIAAKLKELATTWAAQEFDTIKALIKTMPEMPPGVELRQEELWLAPLTVAQAAGGHWQESAWEACTDMSLYGGTPDVVGENLDMLADLTAGWE